MTETDGERLSRIEEKINSMQAELARMSAASSLINGQIYTLMQDTTTALNSTKSAHKRLDDLKQTIFWAVGLSATVVGIFATVFTTMINK
jgi:tetrahydromethanopterin S-methyltransferase subunit G